MNLALDTFHPWQRHLAYAYHFRQCWGEPSRPHGPTSSPRRATYSSLPSRRVSTATATPSGLAATTSTISGGAWQFRQYSYTIRTDATTSTVSVGQLFQGFRTRSTVQWNVWTDMLCALHEFLRGQGNGLVHHHGVKDIWEMERAFHQDRVFF